VRGARGIGTVLIVLSVFTFLLGCESAEKYRKVPSADSTAAPTVGTLAVTGSPAQMEVVKSLAHEMETAELQWDTGNHDAAIATVDSLRKVSEAVLDTIPLDQPIAKFLLVYVTNTYERLIVWGQERSDDNAVKALTGRFESLAARLQVRRDSTAATKTR